MNYLDPNLPRQREAKLKYLNSDFQVLREGDYVRCGVSGTPIRLENLKYWDVERQIAFGSAEISFGEFLARL
ncbi:MAG TPA: DUF2093 domain-containing protein [Aestuariivirga sp.]|jgi:hypothetical protein|nr:DUF2093 domain-containing protein [Aestuariivirga sp.]